MKSGVPVFVPESGYWSNVDQQLMQEAISETECGTNWRTVVDEKLEKYERHITPLFRGDIQYILPDLSEKRVLDAGSMWGGITVPLASRCKEIYAIDKTWESLKFLQLRARQDSIRNIKVAEASVHALLFPITASI